jgi:hypothetical protein
MLYPTELLELTFPTPLYHAQKVGRLGAAVNIVHHYSIRFV